jgi:hypothetical protein
MFPNDTFTRDYQVMAEAMGHNHYIFVSHSVRAE